MPYFARTNSSHLPVGEVSGVVSPFWVCVALSGSAMLPALSANLLDFLSGPYTMYKPCVFARLSVSRLLTGWRSYQDCKSLWGLWCLGSSWGEVFKVREVVLICETSRNRVSWPRSLLMLPFGGRYGSGWWLQPYYISVEHRVGEMSSMASDALSCSSLLVMTTSSQYPVDDYPDGSFPHSSVHYTPSPIREWQLV